MNHFTPVAALIGGGLIGASAALLWLGLGRVAGVSGILAGALTQGGADRRWRIAFLAGLVAAPILFEGVAGPITTTVATPAAQLLAAGLLVGFGARLGGGCTSGHGVCGLARLSPRSLAAAGLFTASAMITVAMTRHVFKG